MQINPYLSFSGDCATAFAFYEQVLGGKIVEMITHGDSPMADQVPAGWKNRVIHASLQVGDRIILGADLPPEHHQPAKGMSLSISIATPEEAERLFAALSESGSVQMELQQTFWSVRFGMLTDKFGTPWMISCDQAP
jgi:PhnB protein